MELKITKEKAISAFNKADASGKELLTNLFGSEALSQKITDRVKNMRDVCDVLGLNYDVEFSTERTKWLTSYELAFKEAALIAQALNEGWTPDYSNSGQYKWYIYYKWVSGSGLSFDVTGYVHSDTLVAPRLIFKSSELAHYAAITFPDTYKQLFSLPNA